jgi:L-threonylcarbamoyladenylate synthase
MSDGPSPTVAADDPGAIAEATAVLASGGAVVLPTDTVYGLAALPTVPGATDALFELKERSERQPLAVLVADIEQALALVEAPAEVVERWMAQLWPGPLTLVLPRSAMARDLPLGGDDATIGVRCPDHPFVRAVAAELGPIATTSANRSGEPTPTTAQGAADALSGPVSLVVDGGPAGTVASTVVDATSAEWRVLREGAVSLDQLEAAAGGVARAGEGGSH